MPFFDRPNDKFTKFPSSTEEPTRSTESKIRNNDKILTRKNDKFCKNCDEDGNEILKGNKFLGQFLMIHQEFSIRKWSAIKN